MSWRYMGISLFAALSVAIVASAPARAASSGKVHSKKSSTPVRCKTRNKAKGTIKYSDWQFPDSLNPYQTNASVSFETIYQMHDDLTQYNGAGKVYGTLLSKLPNIKNG